MTVFLSRLQRLHLHPLLPWLAASLCALYFRDSVRLAVCSSAILYLILYFRQRRALGMDFLPSDARPGRMVLMTLVVVFGLSLAAETLELVVPGGRTQEASANTTPLPSELPPAPSDVVPAEGGVLAGVGSFLLFALVGTIAVAIVLFLLSFPALLAFSVVLIYDLAMVSQEPSFDFYYS